MKRIVGWWNARSTVADANTRVMSAIYTQRLEAFNAGVTPELEVDPYSLMWRDVIHQFQGDPSVNPSQTIERAVDVKAQRKFRSADDVALVFQRENTGANASVVGQNFRVLL